MDIKLIEEGSGDTYKELSGVDGFMFLDDTVFGYRSYLVAKEAGEVVGVICFKDRIIGDDLAFGIGFVESKLKNQGVAKQMIDHLFKLAKEQKRKIRPGTYTDNGEMYIHKVFDKLSTQYGVELIS